MCGIFAILLNSECRSDYSAHFALAMDMLQKRGPEKRTEIKTSKHLLGFQRLSINDLSENGDQPIVSDDGLTTLMCNGEIFNYKELVSKYNLVMRSESDCEAILRLYEKCVLQVDELNGDFAFVIISDKIIVARDRIGVRPLFYGYTNDRSLVISSEVKCMSFCKEIFHVLPGSTVAFDKDNFEPSTELYYDLYSITPISQDIKTLLIDATRKRLLSDRPIGCLLSGGLDSSVICAILCSLLGPKNVRTYSIGMEGSLDLKYA